MTGNEQKRFFREKIKSLETQIQNQKKLIDDLIWVEKKFQIREGFWKYMLDYLPGTVYTGRYTDEWIIEDFTSEVEVLTGYSQIELTGNRVDNFNKFIKENDRERVWNFIKNALSEKENYKVEYNIITKNGKEISVCEKGMGVYNSSGELISFEGFIFKITDNNLENETRQPVTKLKKNKESVENEIQKVIRKNELLKESEKKLKKLNSSKDLFFSIIAHDLKNPFNSLIGLSEMLKDASKNHIADEDIEVLDVINNNIKQVYQLLEELLEWASLQFSRGEFERKKVILADVVKNVCSYFQRNYETKKITVVIDITQDIEVLADERMLETILRNLISNAIKFTDKKGNITVNAEKDKSKIIINIKDSGIGIPITKIDKLFKIDHNYSTTGLEGEKGTGMGLILCKELIEKNNGTIWAESTPKKGSVFSFTLDKYSDKN